MYNSKPLMWSIVICVLSVATNIWTWILLSSIDERQERWKAGLVDYCSRTNASENMCKEKNL